MAFSKVVIFIAIMGMASAPLVMSKEFVVGDENGWKLNFDYQAWAEDKEFHVGDKLIFIYPVGVHNVIPVNGTGFQNCTAPPEAVVRTTGKDVISLATAGRKWYICGVGKHCEAKMKLFITVLDEVVSPAPAPTPTNQTSAALGKAGSSFYGFLMVVAGAVLGMIMV